MRSDSRSQVSSDPEQFIDHYPELKPGSRPALEGPAPAPCSAHVIEADLQRLLTGE